MKRHSTFMNESESVSCSIMFHSLRVNGLQPARLLSPWSSPGMNTGVGCHALLQGIFPTQESNRGLLYCMWILYQLSYQRSNRILFSAKKRNELSIHEKIRRKLKCTLLSGKSQPEKHRYYIIPVCSYTSILEKVKLQS